MELIDTQWVEELRRQVREGIYTWQLEQQMQEATALYETLKKSLTPVQREILDEYIRFLKCKEVSVTHTAYLIGFEHGKKRRGI